MSPLQKLRLQFKPQLPKELQHIEKLAIVPEKRKKTVHEGLKKLFPHSIDQDTFLIFSQKDGLKHKPKRVGVVLSGGQAAGGHNVICGLFDALKQLNADSQLFGFLDGPKGLIENKYKELTAELLASYRNQGGFDLIGSGRTKIETPEQFQAVEAMARKMQLDGIVVIGGDDSNTNAALLAEYFKEKGCTTAVVGVPKTIDGDLKNDDIEISFGFDTASKTYSETIGSIMRDALSAKKSYYFIKMMGRSASHITLECALRTHPNIALISEEIATQKKTLAQLINDICDVICARSAAGKDYGVILIPEGLIEFIPEFKLLIGELNARFGEMQGLTSFEDKLKFVNGHLSQEAKACFQVIPKEIQTQLLMDRDPHGNVQVSKIETERLLIEVVQTELAKRRKAGKYSGKFNGQPHFCGYEGRSCMPSNFDAQYCYSLGYVAALLINAAVTGYICCVQKLTKPVQEWHPGARSLVTMMTLEMRSGKEKPVIEKALVDLNGKHFLTFSKERSRWAVEDAYSYPGPIQFFGPAEITDSIPTIIKQ